mgnify:CR=1 FL=1
MGRTDPIRFCSAAVKSLADENRRLRASRRQWVRLVRNSVGLLFGFDLQAVFNAAEESIRIIQRQNFIAREQIQFS